VNERSTPNVTEQLALVARARRGFGRDALTATLWAVVLMVVLTRLPSSPASWSPHAWSGLGALAAFAVAYTALRWLVIRRRSARFRIVLVFAQLAAVLFAVERLQIEAVPVLLAPVAAQLAAVLELRLALAVAITDSFVLWAIFAEFASWEQAAAPALLYFALQWFAVLMTTSTIRAENARDELARANAELRSIQAFLAETVRDRERLRIARDLHDVTGHKLAALQINLQVLQRQPGPQSEVVERAAQLAAELLVDTRAIVRQMSDAAGLSLEESLTNLRNLLPESTIEVEVQQDLRVQHGEIARLLLRAAQEGVANALRHGGASRIRVSLQHLGQQYVLRVIDNGRGVHRAQAGFGLSQLRERVVELGGAARLRDTPGSGAELEVVLPEELPA
jgi:signal transduction histidine kinase